MNSHTNKACPVTLDDIKGAERRIASEIIRTPVVLSDAASEKAGMEVHLKLENMQHVGAFKVRGALSKVTSLTPKDIQRGLICASSGNHGLGVAYASARFGARCIVVLPEQASLYKISLLKKLGAQIVLCGTTSDIRQQKVDQLSLEHGFVQIHPFADPVLIAGQGTVGLELLEGLPQVDEVYVPVGGGGLISGIAVAVKEQRPKARVFGVEPEYSNAMWEALRHQGPVSLARVETIADGLAAKHTEDLNFSMVRDYVDGIILVSDREILESMLFLLEHARVLVEPSGAASFAGLLANTKRHGCAAAVISGGNITLHQIAELQREHAI